LKWVQQRIEEILRVRWSEFVTGNEPNDIDWGGLQGTLEKELARSLRRELQCQASVTLLLQVPENPPEPAVKVSDGRRRRTRSTAVAS
jgi:ribonuclease J